jgi:hypothetical protein
MDSNTAERPNLFIKLVLVILGIVLSLAGWYRYFGS